MNVGEISIRVKRQFGDESGVQITDEDIIRWINDGQRQIVLQNDNLLQITSLASTIANQNEYDLPLNFLRLMGVHYKPEGHTSYFSMKGMSWIDYQKYVGGTGSGDYYSNNEPQIFSIYGNKLYLFPVPLINGTNNLKIFYNRKPIDVVNSTSVPDLPELYHNALVNYALAQAYGVDEDIESSSGMLEQVNVDVTFLRDQDDWVVRDVYPTITILDEDL